MSDQFGTSCIEGLSNINYNGKNNEKKLENAGGWGGGEYLKTWVEIFDVGIFQGGFTREDFYWWKFSGWELS